MLYVGFVSPHFPLIAPQQFYDMYPENAVPWPLMYEKDERPRHPFTDAMRKCLCFDEPFDAAMVRRLLAHALASLLPDDLLGPTTFALLLAAIGTDDPIVRARERPDSSTAVCVSRSLSVPVGDALTTTEVRRSGVGAREVFAPTSVVLWESTKMKILEMQRQSVI